MLNFVFKTCTHKLVVTRSKCHINVQICKLDLPRFTFYTVLIFIVTYIFKISVLSFETLGQFMHAVCLVVCTTLLIHGLPYVNS